MGGAELNRFFLNLGTGEQRRKFSWREGSSAEKAAATFLNIKASVTQPQPLTSVVSLRALIPLPGLVTTPSAGSWLRPQGPPLSVVSSQTFPRSSQAPGGCKQRANHVACLLCLLLLLFGITDVCKAQDGNYRSESQRNMWSVNDLRRSVDAVQLRRRPLINSI